MECKLEDSLRVNSPVIAKMNVPPGKTSKDQLKGISSFM